MTRENFHVNPQAFAEVSPGLSDRPEARLVLGLDLGTNCGYTYAFLPPGAPPTSALVTPWQMGQWDLSAGSYDSGAIRFVKLRHFLAALKPDAVFYEDVKFDPPGINKMNQGAVLARVATASEFLGALKATVCTWCEEHGVPCAGFKIGTIKKRATGKGNANKEDVIKACNALFETSLAVEGYENTGTDNVADSAFVCLLGLELYGDGLPSLPRTPEGGG